MKKIYQTPKIMIFNLNPLLSMLSTSDASSRPSATFMSDPGIGEEDDE